MKETPIDKKDIESVVSTFRLLTVNKKIGYDIENDPYWTNNRFFNSYGEMKKFVENL